MVENSAIGDGTSLPNFVGDGSAVQLSQRVELDNAVRTEGAEFWVVFFGTCTMFYGLLLYVYYTRHGPVRQCMENFRWAQIRHER